jgi:hypothetical protein
MNLIEELAKKLNDDDYELGDIETAWLASSEYIKNEYRKYIIRLLPIFAEWIRSVKNPFRLDIDDSDSRVINLASETMRETLVEELEKMK